MRSSLKMLLVGMAIAATAHANPLIERDTCILDANTNPDSAAVEDSISRWAADVNYVNSFLDKIQNGVLIPGTRLGKQASKVLIRAQDEPCQLTTLTSISDFQGTPAFDCAKADLERVFEQHVLDNLQTIINDPSDTTTVYAAVHDINLYRCCNVLPDVSILWLDAAEVEGVSDRVPTCAPRPEACSNISCSKSCQLKNGPFGKTC